MNYAFTQDVPIDAVFYQRITSGQLPMIDPHPDPGFEG